MPLSPVATAAHYAQAVPGHNRWHPDIPAVAEVISGGSVRMECQGRAEAGDDDDPAPDVVLCGPVSILGAEPGDILVIDILGVGRGDGRVALAHPGIIGCAPAREAVAAPGVPAVPDIRAADIRAADIRATDIRAADIRAADIRAADGPAADGPLLGHLRPGLAEYRRIAAQAMRSVARGREVAWCAVAPLVTGSRALLPVHAHGAKLSVGDLHFPPRRTRDCDDCRGMGAAGWIDLRINLTKRGMERFRVSGPKLMSEPAGP